MDGVENRALDLIEQVESSDNGATKRSVIYDYISAAEKDPILSESFAILEGCKWINCSRPLSYSDLSGKLVLMDFFTYCCINCIHIMPFLHQLETSHSVTDGLVVIGVHSGKFPNEKLEDNIKSAVKRYDIQHPVINDSDIKIWDEFSIKCWPTLVLISPNGKVLFSIPGESHGDFINLFIDRALEFYELKNQLDKKDIPFTLSLEVVDSPADEAIGKPSKLYFPGKIATDDAGERIAISDSGNNRILICDIDGNVLNVIGGLNVGFIDGVFVRAKFNSPQGLTWHGPNTIFVADCNNHAIRKIDLLVKRVVTVCGTGAQGSDLEGGKPGLDQPISSPWDVVVGGSPRFPGGRSILYIAMSGSHQIWAFIIKTTDYQKGAELEMGTCLRYAGNGNEENRNNSYPHKAGFAQPSGLTVDVEGHSLYAADSESSTIRKINLANGAVQALVGGDIDPMNLFSYGDEDGKGREVKLQHPVGVAWDQKRRHLYVADTYNHKIKIVDPKKKTCWTMQDLGGEGKTFNEPSGLCLDPACEYLYVADTNNHKVKVVLLKDNTLRMMDIKFKSFLESLSLEDKNRPPKVKKAKPLTGKRTPVTVLDKLVVRHDGNIRITLSFLDFKLNPDAPSSWQITCYLSENVSGVENLLLVDSGKFHPSGKVKFSLEIRELLNVLGGEASQVQNSSIGVCVESLLYHCLKDSAVCKVHSYKAVLPLHVVFGQLDDDTATTVELPLEIA